MHGAESIEDRALRGEEDAWSDLFRAHGHQVVVSLVARGARPSEARECAQDAWIRLIEQQRAGKLDRLQLPGLAIRQARFLWLDRQNSRQVVSLDAAREREARGAGSDERVLDRVQLGQALRVLDAESPRDRELFEAAYAGHGTSHDDLASRFGLSLQRTRQVLSEVRTRLRRAMGEG